MVQNNTLDVIPLPFYKFKYTQFISIVSVYKREVTIPLIMAFINGVYMYVKHKSKSKQVYVGFNLQWIT